MKTIYLFAAMAGISLFFSGCTSQSPSRVQAGGPTALTTMGVDLADFRHAAGEVVREMLGNPILAEFKQANQRKPLLNIGDIRNNSDMMIDLDQLAGRINEDLLNSGMVEIIANDAGVVDAAAQQGVGNPKADYFLEGSIMLLSGHEGRVREKSYTFQLRLNDPRTRRMVWQRTIDVAKQTTKAAVSW